MGASNTAQGSIGVRYVPYIEELREFFATDGLHYGSPEDIVVLAERIESSQPFANDLGSMVRSIVYREGGEMPHSQLLEILAVAIGGEQLNQAPQQYGQPLRKLLSFMSGALRKHWYEPPIPEHRAEPSDASRGHLGDLVEFPGNHRVTSGRGYGQAAAISAAAERSAHAGEGKHHPSSQGIVKPGSMNPHPLHLVPADDPRDRRNGPDVVPAPGENVPGDNVPNSDVPDVVGEPTPPERSMFDPHMPADQAVEDPEVSAVPPKVSNGTGDVETGVAAIAADEPALSTQPETVAADAPEALPTPEIVAAPANIPSWQLAAENARGARLEPLLDAAPPKPGPPMMSSPSAAPASQVVPRSSHLQTEPDIAAAPALGPFLEAPATVQATAETGRATEKPSHPIHSISAIPPQFMPRVPRTPAGILVASAALLVLAGVIFATFQPGPTSLTGKHVAVEGPAVAAGDSGPAAPARLTKPTAQGAAIETTTAAPQSASRVRQPATTDDEEDADQGDVAAPYSTPIPGQNSAMMKPSAYVPSPQRASSDVAPIIRPASPPSNEVASAAVPQVPGAAGRGYSGESYTGAVAQPALHPGVVSSYRDPDAAIAGDLPVGTRGSRSATQEGPDQVEVSSGIMAGYVISAPRPDYPGLAKLTHIGGPVVLQAVVAKNGTVLATHVLSGHRLLRGAAEDAVRQWRFRPYMIDGHPVEVSTIITLRFKQKH